MAQEPDLAAQDPQVIHQQIEETRASLTDKLETLENEVKETVTGAKEAVTETVEAVKETVESTVSTVKETVQETVSTVKRTFDLRYQTDQHPWAMVSGSFAAGFITGTIVPMPTGRLATEAWDRVRSATSSNGGTTSYRPVESAVTGTPSAAEEPGMLSNLGDKFETEINKLKGLAIGTTVGLLRDLMTQSMPGELAQQIRGIFDSVTEKLGGKTIEGPVLETFGRR
jgi:ElaB/YqjD/DUF883 family membrane-anchored ribosome-binding protein